MTARVAGVLVVFGHGVEAVGDGFVLTPATAARVRAVADHLASHPTGDRRRIVFTGGWPAARAGEDAPPPGSREGDLMLAAAVAEGLDRVADLVAESRSRSTLENLLNIVEGGLVDPRAFDAEHPLELVSHAWHLPRIRYLAGRALGLPGPAMLDVVATGGEDSTTWWSKRGAYLGQRLMFIGARTPAEMLARERRGVAFVRWVERLVRALDPRRSASARR